MCTTLIITKGATKDGSMIVTHSDDSALEDSRLIKVPAMDYPDGALRPVYDFLLRYPRLVCKDRGPSYDTPGYPETKPIGHIPQVNHTYAYYDNAYGLMNEHNLMLGECTNNAKYTPDYVTDDMAINSGKHVRLLYAQSLSRIALERCDTARDAVKTLGDLIDTYGLFSYGETLLIADKDEGWVFEMCALPDEIYHSAWVAQRVPDGTVFVAANDFRIREIIKDSDDFMYSKLLEPGLYKLGWWSDSLGPIDWMKAVTVTAVTRPYNTFRRVWRVYDLINPDLHLSPWIKDKYTRQYPFSIKPKYKLALQQIFDLYRDHFEGTEFDMTKGVAAGPYGDPTRVRGAYYENNSNAGAWERPISMYNQSFTSVCQLKPNAPEATKGILWYASDIAYTSCFVPFSTKMDYIPLSFSSFNPQKYDTTSAFWRFNFVANWARLNYQSITAIDIRPLQKALEKNSTALVEELDIQAFIQDVTDTFATNAEYVLSNWGSLANMLIAKYANGLCNLEDTDEPLEIGYSSTWLSYTTYKKGSTTY